jgi:predicted CXXCH cytochrome family protein
MISMRASLAAVVTALGAMAWPMLAAAALIYPPAGHLAKEPALTVMAFVDDKAPLAVVIRHEGGGETKGTFQKGFNRWDASLKPGKNTIVWGSESREVFLPAADKKAPDSFVDHPLHQAMDDCGNCHGEGTELKSEMPGLCYDCHDDPSKGEKGKKASVHSPVGDGDCLGCHKAHFSLQPKLLDLAGVDLCKECHDNMAEKDGKPLAAQHDPVTGGECLECHLPHASDSPSLTTEPGAKLCVKCHDDFTLNDKKEKKKFIHEPIGAGECTSCHKPHGSDIPRILTSPVEELCKECHEYPVKNDKGADYAVPHEPVKGGECLSCHDAHASDEKGVTKAGDPALCIECHDDPKKGSGGKELPVVHSAVADGCLGCHRPHGSDYKAMTLKGGATLCNECHDDVRLNPEGFANDFIHKPVAEGNCMACHQIHASTEPKLLALKGNRFCASCHKTYHQNHRMVSERTDVTSNEKYPREGESFACLGCHLPHSSPFEYLFPQDRVTFCADCHKV